MGLQIEKAVFEEGRIVLRLRGDVLGFPVLSFGARDVEFLAEASDEQLADIEVTTTGDAIRWPQINADLKAISLVEVVLGMRELNRGAAAMGRKGGAIGGKARTQAKSVASRANGAKGGRPRKKVAA